VADACVWGHFGDMIVGQIQGLCCGCFCVGEVHVELMYCRDKLAMSKSNKVSDARNTCREVLCEVCVKFFWLRNHSF
jgi:hypothetical protein